MVSCDLREEAQKGNGAILAKLRQSLRARAGIVNYRRPLLESSRVDSIRVESFVFTSRSPGSFEKDSALMVERRKN